ncbi:energy transducer TonB [Anaerospora hongkongensis]|uniref:energy transducer TonB n=1 Tax=Anaerospora hongkongensis TaxID=244830 RepID=UPI0028A0F8D9|nr:energy transducer TonB [Anaerospora hongkongensis]
MSYTYYWRKALSVSLLLHLFFLAAAGYLSAGWTAPPPVQEVLLEMDLVNDPAERAGVSALPPAPSLVPEVPRQSQPVPAETLPTEEPAEALVTTSELAMTEAQPVAAAAAAPASSGGSPDSIGSSAIGGTSSGGSIKGGGIAAPGILSKSDPVYPSSARKAGQEGTVLLRIEILTNGRTGAISVARSTGYAALDEAAIEAVANWQFIPAKDLATGRTVPCTTTLPVSFRLR